MSVKIIENGLIIDVVDNPVWIGINSRGRIVRCKASNATGILSSDESVIYHISGAAPLGEYRDVIVADISDDEARTLKEKLDIGGDIPSDTEDIPEENSPIEEEPQPEEEPIMSASAMRRQIMDLTNALTTVEEQNAMLIECILEMSEVVYGGV